MPAIVEERNCQIVQCKHKQLAVYFNKAGWGADLITAEGREFASRTVHWDNSETSTSTPIIMILLQLKILH